MLLCSFLIQFFLFKFLKFRGKKLQIIFNSNGFKLLQFCSQFLLGFYLSYEDSAIYLFGGKNNIAGKVPGKNYYYCDGIAWHKYPQDNAVNLNLAYAGIDDFETSIVKCKEKIDAVNTQLGRTGDEALGWGIGEFNAKNGSYVHTWGNGQMFAGILNLCMKYKK